MNTLFWLATMLARKGDFSKARTLFEYLSHLSPSFDYLLGAVFCATRQKDFASAAKWQKELHQYVSTKEQADLAARFDHRIAYGR